MRVLLAAILVVLATLGQARPASAATCVSSTGPGIAPPASVPTGVPGFHAVWYGQSGYMRLCPGERSTATVAFYNSGSRGWVGGRMGEAAYLGTWDVEPGQDQPSILGGDGQRGTPATGWPRYDRPAVQPAAWVGPNQVAWFQFVVQAPARPGTYRLGIRPLIEGTTWLEDYGVFWEITVLKPDGSLAPATPSSPAGFYFTAGPGLAAADVNDLHQGVEWASAYLRSAVGGDRTRRASARIVVGDGTERFCCVTSGPSFDIVTSNTAWSAPQAAAPDTWAPDDERTELAAHEYIHVWQYDLGGRACMLGPRWISEGMAESLAYRALVAAGRIGAANLDVFTKRQLRTARYVPLRSLETAWPADVNPFAVGYLAVDRLLASPSPLALRVFCTRVGAGEAWQSAFAVAFGVDVDTFYARYEAFRAEYVR
ncbi:MAG: hypothetical protein M3R54_02925 [Chloroflexota bacterium]|nr:hypothetical protein [Chloroflexota bacterium]